VPAHVHVEEANAQPCRRLGVRSTAGLAASKPLFLSVSGAHRGGMTHLKRMGRAEPLAPPARYRAASRPRSLRMGGGEVPVDAGGVRTQDMPAVMVDGSALRVRVTAKPETPLGRAGRTGRVQTPTKLPLGASAGSSCRVPLQVPRAARCVAPSEVTRRGRGQLQLPVADGSGRGVEWFGDTPQTWGQSRWRGMPDFGGPQ